MFKADTEAETRRTGGMSDEYYGGGNEDEDMARAIQASLGLESEEPSYSPIAPQPYGPLMPFEYRKVDKGSKNSSLRNNFSDDDNNDGSSDGGFVRPEDVDIPLITVNNDEQGQGGDSNDVPMKVDKKKEDLKVIREEKMEEFLRW